MEITKKKIMEYAERYDQRYKVKDKETENEMKGWLKKNRYLNSKGFVKIGLWKSRRPKKRYESNADITVKEITRFSFATKCEKARIESLLVLSGVSYPVASAILHFAFPKRYPIMDFRAIWSLGWEQPKYYTFYFWEKYCTEIRIISEKLQEDIRTVDKALWQYSKENQNM